MLFLVIPTFLSLHFFLLALFLSVLSFLLEFFSHIIGYEFDVASDFFLIVRILPEKTFHSQPICLFDFSFSLRLEDETISIAVKVFVDTVLIAL
jgi:hypothetical protein